MDSLVDFLLNFHGPTPYLIVFGILLLCGLGLPLPEDIVLFAGGLLAYYGVCDIWTMIAVAMAGVLIGDTTMFVLGSRWGGTLSKFWLFKKLFPEQRLKEVQKQFHARGNKVIFAGRFMPGLRSPIFFSAGMLHLPFRVFIFYDGVAALLSVPAIVGAVYYFGDELDQVVRVIKSIEHSIVLVIVGAALLMFGKWYFTHRRLNRGA